MVLFPALCDVEKRKGAHLLSTFNRFTCEFECACAHAAGRIRRIDPQGAVLTRPDLLCARASSGLCSVSCLGLCGMQVSFARSEALGLTVRGTAAC